MNIKHADNQTAEKEKGLKEPVTNHTSLIKPEITFPGGRRELNDKTKPHRQLSSCVNVCKGRVVELTIQPKGKNKLKQKQ